MKLGKKIFDVISNYTNVAVFGYAANVNDLYRIAMIVKLHYNMLAYINIKEGTYSLCIRIQIYRIGGFLIFVLMKRKAPHEEF